MRINRAAREQAICCTGSARSHGLCRRQRGADASRAERASCMSPHAFAAQRACHQPSCGGGAGQPPSAPWDRLRQRRPMAAARRNSGSGGREGAIKAREPACGGGATVQCSCHKLTSPQRQSGTSCRTIAECRMRRPPARLAGRCWGLASCARFKTHPISTRSDLTRLLTRAPPSMGQCASRTDSRPPFVSVHARAAEDDGSQAPYPL